MIKHSDLSYTVIKANLRQECKKGRGVGRGQGGGAFSENDENKGN